MWVQYGAAAVAAVWAETQAEEQILAPSKTVAATACTALERMGQAGDMFRGFNALFSAFAFSGVAVAAYFHWKMNRQVRVQAFESTFFSAVELLHKIAEGISYDPYLHAQLPLKAPRATKSPIIGREAFQEILNGLANCNPLSPSDTQGLYKSLQSDHNYMLGHYFRHLYQTLMAVAPIGCG